MRVAFNSNNELIITSINDDIIHSIVDQIFRGNIAGFISFWKNAIFIYMKIFVNTLRCGVDKMYYRVFHILIISFGPILKYIQISYFFINSFLSF